MLRYTLKGFAPETADPVMETVVVSRDSDALDAGRGLLLEKLIQSVEVWRDERRIATVERFC
ncbi:MAG: hypothetical protein ABW360_10055 [Phenylobacterium sp.]